MATDPPSPSDQADGPPGDDVVLTDFAAPTALPSMLARALAFSSIIVASVCGGIMGFAITDLSCTDGCSSLAILGAVGGALIASIGTAIIAVLVLRAMAEWEDQASVRAR